MKLGQSLRGKGFVKKINLDGLEIGSNGIKYTCSNILQSNYLVNRHLKHLLLGFGVDWQLEPEVPRQESLKPTPPRHLVFRLEYAC